LTNELGEQAMGVFAAPGVIEAEILERYDVEIVGRSAAVRQQFYALTTERKIAHPAVIAICQAARQDLLPRPGRAAAAKPSRPRRRSAAASGPSRGK
jgi:LysR family transcriptional activator of nhaA